jgi:hypothetical protein
VFGREGEKRARLLAFRAQFFAPDVSLDFPLFLFSNAAIALVPENELLKPFHRFSEVFQRGFLLVSAPRK